MSKVSAQLSDTQKQLDALKRKYAEEVEAMKLTQEEESAGRSERIRELEQQAKAAEEALEMTR